MTTDPYSFNMMEEILKKTVTVTQTVTERIPFPDPTTTSSIAPIPTVIPGGSTTFQEINEAGKRTLW